MEKKHSTNILFRFRYLNNAIVAVGMGGNKKTHNCALFSNSRSEDTEATFFAKESNSALKC